MSTYAKAVLGIGVAVAAPIVTLAATAPAPAAVHATTATVVATVQGDNKPLDAAPDPGGRTIYFTTEGADGPAILRVAAGGGSVATVLRGAPLVHPDGIAVSRDGNRLFVADRGAGRILVVPVGGGRPRTLAGSAGTSPRGLEIQRRGAASRIVFTGADPSDGRRGVFALPASGARSPAVLAKGAPLRLPRAIAIARSGAIYVSDRGSGRRLGGRVLNIAGGHVTQIASGIRLGAPAGLALTEDERTLLVSARHPGAGTAQVVLVDTKTRARGTFDDVIRQSHAAGGLHRAFASPLMAWADSSRAGRIYRIDP